MIKPGGQPYFLPGGPFGCLLIHSLGSSPHEVRWLGTQLNQDGFSVLAIRLCGHATNSKDLKRTRYADWIAAMEDGFSLLQKQCKKTIVVGTSFGSVLALIAGAKLSVDALVAISPPYDLQSLSQARQLSLPNPILRMLKLGKRSIHQAASLPGLIPHDETSPLFYPTIPTRTISEIELLLTEMRRVLPSVDVPTLIIHTDVENDSQSQSATQILDHLETKRVKMLKVKGSGSGEALQIERERVTRSITSFVTNLPGFQE